MTCNDVTRHHKNMFSLHKVYTAMLKGKKHHFFVVEKLYSPPKRKLPQGQMQSISSLNLSHSHRASQTYNTLLYLDVVRRPDNNVLKWHRQRL